MELVFICYSSKDRDLASQLNDALEKAGLNPWIDKEDLHLSSPWRREIENAITESVAFVYLASGNSLRSEYCQKELFLARQLNKRIFPILIPGTSDKEIPDAISSYQWSKWEDFGSNFDVTKLVTDIKKDYEWVKYITNLEVLSYNWERDKDNSHLLNGKRLREAENLLAVSSQKDPSPTDLQKRFVKASRKRANTIRNSLVGIGILGLFTFIVLTVFTLRSRLQASQASQSEATAKLIAEEKTAITHAENLAAQSVLMRDKDYQTSLLLGIEAFQQFDTVTTRSVLLDNFQVNPQVDNILVQNQDGITVVAFNSKEDIFASGSYDGSIVLWDVNTLKPIGDPLKGSSEDIIGGLSFSPDGKMLASSTNDKKIVLWDVNSRKPIGSPMIGKLTFMSSIVFSPDGNLLAVGGCSDYTGIYCQLGGIEFWDVQTQSLVQTIYGHDSLITDIAFTNIAQNLISVSDTNTIIIWDTESGEAVYRFSYEDQYAVVGFVTINIDGSMMATGGCVVLFTYCSLGEITLWDTKTFTIIEEIKINTSPMDNSVLNATFSSDGKTLAAALGDNNILLFDVETRQSIGFPLTGHTLPADSLSFSTDGTKLLSGGLDGKLILWNVGALQSIKQTLYGHTESVNSVAFSSDGKTLASGSSDSTVLIWDLESEQPTIKYTLNHSAEVLSVAINPNENVLASGSADGTVRLWNISSGKLIGAPLFGQSNLVKSVAFNNEGSLLASGSCGEVDNFHYNGCVKGEIILWDVKNQKIIGEPLIGHSDVVLDLAFSNNGKMLASSSADGTIVIWDVNTRQEITILAGHQSGVESIVFTKNDLYLVSGSDDTTIIFWDMKNFEQAALPLLRSTDSILSIALNPNDTWMASGNYDNSISLWDTQVGQPIGKPLIGYTDKVLDVSFSPDGDLLATVSADKTIVLWNINPQTWIEKTCQRAGRNFTYEEWDKYFPGESYRTTCPQWISGK